MAALDTPQEKRASAERLGRAYARAGEAWAARMAGVCRSEIEAVLRGDIPYFFSYGNERCLRDMQGVAAEEYYAHAPVEAARMRLAALSEADIEAQLRVIRQSLGAVNPEIRRMKATDARCVFDLLEGAQVFGCPSVWMGVTTGAKGEAYFQSAGFDLYDGLLGVLVFYAALYEATGDGDVLAALERHYASYRAWYIEPEHRLRAQASSICLTSGVGGHIMALGYLSRALRDGRYRQDAAKLLSRFDFEDCEIGEWDVYSGAAGLLIALPLLRGCGMDGQLARIAARLARVVCSAQVELTGFAHGAAGAALALCAAQRVGGGDWTQEILRLLAWEDALYDEAALNWPDLRDPQQHGFMKGLCAGAPGIGLARLQLSRCTEDARIQRICREDMDHVRAFLRAQKTPLRRDTLCCGNAALAEAARVLLSGEEAPPLNAEPVLYHALATDDLPAGSM